MRKDILTAVQTRLAGLGYYAGKLDGTEGPLTSLAITDFKTANGLSHRDFVGEITLSRLFAADAEPKTKAPPIKGNGATTAYPWYAEAVRLLGLKETPGAKSNPVIMQWAKDAAISYSGDDIAWCGLFMAHTMKTGAPLDAQYFNRLSARAWEAYGYAVKPCVGSIGVFWRQRRDGWKGHVALIVGEDATTYHVLGGNQNDSVSLSRISKDRLLSARFPKSFKPNPAFVLHDIVKGGLSVNEA